MDTLGRIWFRGAQLGNLWQRYPVARHWRDIENPQSTKDVIAPSGCEEDDAFAGSSRAIKGVEECLASLSTRGCFQERRRI
jgi:hypothetical protein